MLSPPLARPTAVVACIMQVHSPSHISTSIYHLCGKPDWVADPPEKNSMLNKTQKLKKAKEKKRRIQKKHNKEESRRGKRRDKRKKPIKRKIIKVALPDKYLSRFTVQLHKWLS